MSIKIEIKGHGVKQLSKFMRQFRGDIERINNRSALRVAMKGEAEAVKHIEAQDLGWAPLSPHYAAQKLKNGQSDKVLVATSTYLQSITTFQEKGRAWAGVRKDVKTADGQEVASIAAVLEFGSVKRGVPARPLWSIVLRDLATWVRSTNYFTVEVVKELKRKYGQGGPDDASPGPVPEPNVNMKNAPSLSTGKRGGRYHLSASGRKVYHKRP